VRLDLPRRDQRLTRLAWLDRRHATIIPFRGVRASRTLGMKARMLTTTSKFNPAAVGF
jgi:hypothetical protein